jgi:hypothetical protein
MKHILYLIALLWGISAQAQTPTDSIGIYAVKDGSITKMQPVSYKGTKISRGFASAKAKLEFDGSAAATKFNGTAVFRLYFGTPAATEMRTLYMFTPMYSVSDFSVGSFEVKKQQRLLTTSSVSLAGGRMGAQDAKGVTVEATQLHDNVYEIKVSGAPGEYCIMHSSKGTGGYSGVFDFSIE